MNPIYDADVPLERLETMVRRISFESESAQATVVTDESKNLFNTLTQAVRSQFDKLFKGFKEKDHIKAGIVTSPQLDKQISETNYLSLSKIALPIPIGLMVPYVDLLPTLIEGQQISESFLVKTVKPIEVYLSSLIANPKRLSSLQGNTPVEVTFHDSEINDCKNVMKTAFDTAHKAPFKPYGELFRRNKEWADVMEQSATLTLMIKDTPYSEMAQSLSALSGLIDKLSHRMKSDPDVYAMNKITSASISQLIYKLAREFEFIAAHRQVCIEVLDALDESVKKLEPLL